MIKAQIYSNWFNTDLFFPVFVEIWIDMINISENNNSIKILILCEPSSILDLTDYVINNYNKYNYILTYNTKLLTLPNAIKLEYGTSWIQKNSQDVKEESISFICGGKNLTDGHKFRHKIWNTNIFSNIPLKRYMSSNFSFSTNIPCHILNKKEEALHSMFHIVVENCKQDYYFSEKLLDPIRVKSIPIYWGCTRINEYFDTKSIYCFNTIEELIDICNNINTKDYYDNLNAINDNLTSSEHWANYHLRIENTIKNLI